MALMVRRITPARRRRRPFVTGLVELVRFFSMVPGEKRSSNTIGVGRSVPRLQLGDGAEEKLGAAGGATSLLPFRPWLDNPTVGIEIKDHRPGKRGEFNHL